MAMAPVTKLGPPSAAGPPPSGYPAHSPGPFGFVPFPVTVLCVMFALKDAS